MVLKGRSLGRLPRAPPARALLTLWSTPTGMHAEGKQGDASIQQRSLRAQISEPTDPNARQVVCNTRNTNCETKGSRLSIPSTQQHALGHRKCPKGAPCAPPAQQVSLLSEIDTETRRRRASPGPAQRPDGTHRPAAPTPTHTRGPRHTYALQLRVFAEAPQRGPRRHEHEPRRRPHGGLGPHLKPDLIAHRLPALVRDPLGRADGGDAAGLDHEDDRALGFQQAAVEDVLGHLCRLATAGGACEGVRETGSGSGGGLIAVKKSVFGS